MKTLYAARFARVTENLARQGLTQMIVSDPPTIFYLTGVRIQPGERMLALLLRADGNHRFFVNALFGTPEAGIPVENYSDGEDALILEGPLPLAPHDVAGMQLQVDAARAEAAAMVPVLNALDAEHLHY